MNIEYRFEWDPSKAKNNIEKHGISFREACSVFQDPKALSIYDEEHSQQEERWITLGASNNGNILVICHTYIKTYKNTVRIRIISSRKATKKEETKYWESL